MRPVMREGQTEPRANLKDLIETPAMYGVGAMAGLRGEVTLRDGEVWITRLRDGAPVTMGPAVAAEEHATLLTVAQARSFHEQVLEQELGGTALEQAIRACAVTCGIDAAQPFIFTVRGRMRCLQLHVVDGACLHADPSAEGLRITIPESTPVEIVGVHAEGQAGVMTHHGTSVHMHALLDWKGRRITAHVDALTTEPGARLGVAIE